MDLKNYDQFLFEERIGKSWTEDEKTDFAKFQHDNLMELFDALSKYKIKHWIDCGTLLGIYRDKCLIPGDSDTDTGVLIEDMMPDFVEDHADKLSKIPSTQMFFEPAKFLKMHEDLENSKPVPPKNLKFSMLIKGRQKKYKGKAISADIFLYYPLKTDRIYRFGSDYFRTKNSILDAGTKKMTVDGKQYPILNKTEDHLEVTYGKGWKEPDPSFKVNKARDLYGGPLSSKDIGGKYLYHLHTRKYTIE